ncbi:hypothetical protein [Methanobrevibacter sp.]
MLTEFEKIHNEAMTVLNYIISNLNNNSEFYEGDFNYEYSTFEESLKSYCDKYASFYLNNGEGKIFFNSLVLIVETIVGCDADAYYEDFFRPAELLTYYLGKIISQDNGLKKEIYEWLADFCRDFEDDMIVKDYFKLFINGEKIYPGDNYYTDYDDFNKMIQVFK